MKRIAFLLSLFVAFTVVSCDNKLMMTLPQGPEGPQGEPGISVYEFLEAI